MANGIYAAAKQAFLSGTVDLTTDVVSVLLVDTSAYTVDLATDTYLDDIAGGAQVAVSDALGTVSVTGGVVMAADALFETPTGPECEAMVLFVDTGTPATSLLLVYIDTATGLPVDPAGVDITVRWADAGIFALEGEPAPGASYADAAMATTPTIYWRQGEASGTTGVDLSGNGFDGTYIGSPTLGATGLVGDADTAVTYNGTDDRLQRHGLGDILTTTAAISAGVWINTTSMPPGWDWVYVVRGSASPNPYLTLEVTDTGALGLSLGDVAPTFGWLDGPVIADGLDHLLVATWDNATQLLILYVDGVEYAATAMLGNASPLPTFDEVGVADWPDPTADSPLVATLDEFLLNGTALSSTQVADLWAAGTP